ncbi:energy coupling factor transporter S component ThiW [Lachnoclostridium sp. Marseille-P6806]|uniref:energy coupling factor transporter S component ThiW n=1 Tax=Lachnoclostridium sp. Marseille-P6806 TaxID=2364793 RepID=UPI002414EB4B|nr:energy coupling factor transporter S component ThiW [Lachnoclostridium sp. Marseille-P6806]
MKTKNVKKLAASGMFVALILVLSGFYIPVGASKCFPVQHMVNVLAAVLLGPWWGVGIAFAASLFRNLMGTGTLLAFPGSMVGALCCGLCWRFSGKLLPTYLAEIFGTGVIGGLLAFPVATLFMGKEAALFAYVLPFLVSTAGGTILAAVLVAVLAKTKALDALRQLVDG